MTCFWDGILAKLSNKLDTAGYKLEKINSGSRNADFIEALKRVARSIDHAEVSWNGEIISKQLWKEYRVWIEDYNVATIGNGHDCGTCDPFLILLCYMLRITIKHNYNGSPVVYKYLDSQVDLDVKQDVALYKMCKVLGVEYIKNIEKIEPVNRFIVEFNSDRGHFW